MTLQSLINACGADENHLRALATESVSLWKPWLKPLADTKTL
ncbi:hypothetical protein [Pantoea sp. S61]|nr:hypothetical protein [Pantoea sp. S61]